MTISVAEQYKFVALQMAAEGTLIDGDGKAYQGPSLTAALIRGNGHSSKFTATEAEYFATHWRVVAQNKETGTGFCGTLFECIQADPTTGAVLGERVMSFRSTGFIDDAVRDNEATNQHEIRETGWAWGQIRDMEQWYAQLRADPTSFGDSDFSVTGYSLGGHLASVFNLLHPNQAKQVVTFNGAGVGDLARGIPTDEFEKFKEMSVSGGANLIEQAIADPLVVGWYREVRDMLARGASDAAKMAIAYLDEQTAILGNNIDERVEAFRHTAKPLYVSLANIDALIEEAWRLPTLVKGGDGDDAGSRLGGDDTYLIDHVDDNVFEVQGEGTDTILTSVSIDMQQPYYRYGEVENLTLIGTAAISGVGNELDNVIIGNGAANSLSGGDGNDTLDGGAGADTLSGGAGDDIFIVDNTRDAVVEASRGGTDQVRSSVTHTLSANVESLVLTGTAAINGTGNSGSNLLIGNGAANTLAGGGGNDILQGGAGADQLNDTSGKNLFDGGAGNDTIVGGTGADMYIGGKGNDTITTSTGADVILFNRGDGSDSVAASMGSDNTLSLGGGIGYADLSFSKTGNNLVLGLGGGDSITFTNWYQNANSRSVYNLQIFIGEAQEYDPASDDPMLNQAVQLFDFETLDAAFDAARAATPGLNSWSLSLALEAAHLAANTDGAYGARLAQAYAQDGAVTGINMVEAQTIIGYEHFGIYMQTIEWAGEPGPFALI